MIFLGAGASAPFGIPTADTLTVEIRDMLSGEHQDLLDAVTKFWTGNYDGKEPNYENILTVLMGLTNPRKIARDSIVRAFISNFKEYKADYESIIDEMYSRIITYCTAPFVSSDKYIEPTKLEEIFRKTYDLFTLRGDDVVFTTNYDPSIELWCQKRNIQIYDGMEDTRNPEIRKALLVDDNTVAEGKTDLRPSRGGKLLTLKIVRLHGSVWVYETKKGRKIKMNRPRDRLLFTDWYNYLDKNPSIIFPGQESDVAGGEWDVYYQYFKKMLRKTCLVIGYSFNDSLINRVFVDNLNKGLLDRIGIVSPNPNEVTRNLFWNQEIPRDRILQMPVEFGTDQAVQEIYQKWISGVRGTHYDAGVDRALSYFRECMKGYLD